MRNFGLYRKIVTEFVAWRSDSATELFEKHGYLPSTPAPTFNRYRGSVTAPFSLQIQAAEGELFVTSDGRDPRDASSDEPSATASTLSSPAQLELRETTHVKARARAGAVWSALTETVLLVDHDLADLRISELMYHPTASPDPADVALANDFEWLELHNAGDTPLQLRGVYFCDGISFRFAEHRVLPADAYVVLARNGPAFHRRHPAVGLAGVYAGSLDNGGERIALCDATGRELLTVRYGDDPPWPAEADGAGHSLVLEDPARHEEADAWRLSSALGGSPGTVDPSPPTPGPIAVNKVNHTEPTASPKPDGGPGQPNDAEGEESERAEGTDAAASSSCGGCQSGSPPPYTIVLFALCWLRSATRRRARTS